MVIEIVQSKTRRKKLNSETMTQIPFNIDGKPLYKKNKKCQEEHINYIRLKEQKQLIKEKLNF